MNPTEKHREFSMKYCPNLEDHVVVMTTGQAGDTQNKVCLSAHLCHTDMRMNCGHEAPFSAQKPKDSVTM